MSTATYDRPPLYAVPAQTEQQAKFGLLLALRRHARQALDTLLHLPRGATGWVLRHLRTLLDGVGQHHLLDQPTTLLRNGISFVRRLGVIPLVASVLSSPPVWRTATSWAQAAGTALAGFGRGLWARAKGLLTRSGTGARIAQALSNAGTTVVMAARAVASHPAVQQVSHAVRALAGLVRPLSQTVVVHRLLGLLVPGLWLRVALEALAMPLVIALGMPGVVPPAGRSGPAPVAPQGAPAAHPAVGVATAASEPDVDAPWSHKEGAVDAPLNRAERRAQQQEQARARRSHTRR